MACQSEEFDFASLPILDEAILLEGLRNRYEKDIIYSYVGDILLAVNPFQDLDIYGAEYTRKYQQVKLRWTLPPHIFAVADATYQAICSYHENQCCIISGESGAGKTESAKLIVQHVIELCQCSNDLQHQILQVNPLLEAFGNARTVMNNNSSRFGKFLELQFDSKFTVTGAKITEYLLEKSRVVSQSPGESNFHIFYYLSAGLSEEQKKTLLLHNNHRFIATRQWKEEEQILTNLENRNSFDVVCRCFDVVGFSKEEIDAILSILAAILHIGDIQFRVKKGSEEAVVQDKSEVSTVIKLLDLDPVEFEQSLITTLSMTRGESICRLHTVLQAEDTRDATAKALYGRLFAWIVSKINQTLCYQGKKRKSQHNIAILDIFGFENFKQNSFEQLCINVANEQLQFYFNQHIFAWEKEQYISEGITIKENITYVNNKPLCDIFLKKPIGLLTLLDEESKFPQATDNSLVLKFNRHFSKNDYYLSSQDGRAVSFAIRHYAGKVTYNAKGFLEKNRDSLSNNMTDCLKASGCELVSEMFINKLTRTGSMLRRTTQILNMDKTKDKSHLPAESKKADIKSATMVLRRHAKADITLRRQQSMERRKGSITVAAKSTLSRPVTKGPMTLANHFRNSLSDLMEKMLASTPHFVRCIKPNKQQVPRDFDSDFVMKQLRYTGVMETVRIRRHGYPTRLPFADFVERYKLITCGFTDRVEPSKRVCQAILKCSGLHGWQVGKTKVFLKYQHADNLMAIINSKLHNVIITQNVVRGWYARRVVAKLRDEAVVQVVAIETMMEFIVMSGQWNDQYRLNKTDQMITEDQLQLIETVMAQVTAGGSECCAFLHKLNEEDNKLRLIEGNLIELFCSEIAMASVCIQCQLCALSEEDSKNVITEERQVTKFLSSVTCNEACEEQLEKMKAQEYSVAINIAQQLSCFLSMVSHNSASCYQQQQLLCQQDKINVTSEEVLITQLMTQANQSSNECNRRVVMLNEEDDIRHKQLLQEWQRLTMLPAADSKGGGEQQNMEIEGDAVTNENIDRTLLATVDNTLLQTLQDHMIQCSPTPYKPASAVTHTNNSWFGVLCYEDNICLGQVLLNSPVLVVDGSADNSIMSHIALGSFPNCNPTSSYAMYRHHIGLGVMVNCDDIGDVWITRLSESEVVVIADGDLYGNNIVALPKGEPTKVFSMDDFKVKMTANIVAPSNCFIVVSFSDQRHASSTPYHAVIYLNDAIMSLAGKLKISRYALLSNYLMPKYGSSHLLEVFNSEEEGVAMATEDYSVRVLGWQMVTLSNKEHSFY